MSYNHYANTVDYSEPVSFRQQDETDTENRAAVDEYVQDDEGGDENNIICRNCYNLLTKGSNKIFVHGAHRHIFANPHGLVFEIGCFKNVIGCGYTGITTNEFSWFKGYSWKIAVCNMCLVHLGWVFTAVDKEQFHGLILSQIVESQSSSSKGVY